MGWGEWDICEVVLGAEERVEGDGDVEEEVESDDHEEDADGDGDWW